MASHTSTRKMRKTTPSSGAGEGGPPPGETRPGRGVANEITAAAPWVEALRRHSERLAADWVALRRRLHAHPELSGQEFETTAALREHVRPWAVVSERDQRPGFWADRVFEGRSSSLPRPPRVALRADIDALPIQTELTTPYASRRAGCMHACGHDVHAATVAAAIELLDAVEGDGLLPHPLSLRAIFQPAEETSQGAIELIHDGALEGVQRIFALHVDPSLAQGTVGLRHGALTANCDVFEVSFRGVGGHTARPQLTNDLPAAVSHWISQLYQRLPRTLDPFHPTVATVASIRCGEASNVLPTKASVLGTLRSTDRETHDEAWQTMHRISRATAELFDCHVHSASSRMTPGVVNELKCMRLLTMSAEAVLGAPQLWTIPQPSMGAEDFSFYLQKVPGAMFRLGVAGSQTGGQPLHTPRFDIDERAIAVGARVLAAVAIAHSISAANRDPDDELPLAPNSRRERHDASALSERPS